MAKPSRAQDPTAAALSAIEEALNLGDPAEAQPAAKAPAAEGEPAEAGEANEGEADSAALGAGVQLPKARTTPIDDWTAPDLNLPEHADAHLGEHAADRTQAAAVVDQPAVPPRPAQRDAAPLAP